MLSGWCCGLQVVATEVSKASVAAARHNIEANGISNIFLARMSSEEFVETWRVKGTRYRLTGLDWEQLELKTLLVDPPR
jgi:tRNA (uracil-5-)-methyltransferase